MKNLVKAILWIGLGLFGFGLFLLIYLGFYNRFWADDWCYGADLKTLGLWGTLQGYTFITHYASNRYSLTLFMGLLQFFGVYSAQGMALLVVSLWFGGLFLVLRGLLRFLGLEKELWLAALAAAVLEYYALYLAPNQFQILYWRAGSLPYAAPLIGTLYIFGLLLWQAGRAKQSRLLLVGLALLSFLTGGFSEGACATLVAALGLFWLAAWIGQQRGAGWAKSVFPAVTVALVFALLAMLVLALSPANAVRRQLGDYPAPTPVLLVPVYAILFTLDFIQSSLRGLILPHLVISAIFFLLPFAAALLGVRVHLSLRVILKASLLVVVVVILLIAASQAPTVYFEKGPPAARGMLFARFGLFFALAAIFWLGGSFLALRLKPNLAVVLALGLVLPLAYTVRPLLATYADLPAYRQRAAIWDERDAAIRAAQAQGILQIDVRAIDGAPVGNILDFKEKPTFWTNACAAIYYGMDEIRATKP